MGPNIRFTREQIIDAAFEIAKTEGMDKISMRKIAELTGSSVAPIYVNFKNIDELNEALIERIVSISQQLLEEENTGNPFYDMGSASLRFALEYSIIFKDMVTKGSKYLQDYDDTMLPILIEEMKKEPELEEFTEDELKKIFFKMRIFQLGLSIMAANGSLPKEYTKQKMMEILCGIADDMIAAAKLRRTLIDEK